MYTFREVVEKYNVDVKSYTCFSNLDIYFYAFSLFDKNEIDAEVFIKFLSRFITRVNYQRHNIGVNLSDAFMTVLLSFKYSKRITPKFYFENRDAINTYITLVGMAFYMDRFDVEIFKYGVPYMHYKDIYIAFKDDISHVRMVRPIFEDSDLIELESFSTRVVVSISERSIIKINQSASDFIVGVYGSKSEMIRGLVLHD